MVKVAHTLYVRLPLTVGAVTFNRRGTVITVLITITYLKLQPRGASTAGTPELYHFSTLLIFLFTTEVIYVLSTTHQDDRSFVPRMLVYNNHSDSNLLSA